MSIYDAFLALPDVDFTCKWALEFGDSRLIRILAEKHPERMIESAIDLGRVPWMIDLVQRYGIGAERIRDHILNKGSIKEVLSLVNSGLVDMPAIQAQLAHRAANPDCALEMLTLLRSKPQKLVEEALVATGHKGMILELARIQWCELAKDAAAGMRDCEHVMES